MSGLVWYIYFLLIDLFQVALASNVERHTPCSVRTVLEYCKAWKLKERFTYLGVTNCITTYVFITGRPEVT